MFQTFPSKKGKYRQMTATKIHHVIQAVPEMLGSIIRALSY